MKFFRNHIGEQYSSREPRYDYSINHGSYSAGVLCVVVKWNIPVVFLCRSVFDGSQTLSLHRRTLIWTLFKLRNTHSALSVLPHGGDREGPTYRTLMGVRTRSQRGATAGIFISFMIPMCA